MSFRNIRFPVNISYGSDGGPEYSTSIVETHGGVEQRVLNWAYPRCRYNVAYGIRHERDLEEVLYFFHLAQGRAHTFRYKDWSDYKTCLYDETPAQDDVFIDTNYGSTPTMQLRKGYTVSGTTYYRKITLPVQGTVKVCYQPGATKVSLTEGVDYTINYSTGLMTILSPSTKQGAFYAGFEFDVMCRFDVDKISVKLDTYTAASTELPLVEVRI